MLYDKAVFVDDNRKYCLSQSTELPLVNFNSIMITLLFEPYCPKLLLINLLLLNYYKIEIYIICCLFFNYNQVFC